MSLLVATALPVCAQQVAQRLLPSNGERGRLGAPQPYPLVQIGKSTYRLAPGARIMDTSNRTIVHGHLPPGADVLFARESSGDVLRIYILSEPEIARLPSAGRK